MSQVIEILRSLGIDSTVYFQFAIFFIAYFVMSNVVFKPYLKAYDERMRRTVGGQEEAESLLDQAKEKEEKYKKEAKKLNTEIKEIFNGANLKAKKEVEEILSEARKEADEQLEQARNDLDRSVDEARKEMKSHIPTISENIQKKFVRQ